MAILIQQLENVINIIETTAAAGSQIIRALSTSCIAVPKTQEVTDTVIQILDDKGKPTYSVNFDGTLQVQDKGGAAAPFVGTRDALLDKLNDTYFINAVTTSGGGGGGDSSAANQLTQITEAQNVIIKLTAQLTELQSIVTNTASVSVEGKQDSQITELQSIVTNTTGKAVETKQDTQITELQKLTGANSPSHQELNNPASVVISSFKTLSFICKGSISVTLDGNTIVYPQNLGGGSKVFGSTFEADSTSLNAATFNGTGKVFLTIKQ